MYNEIVFDTQAEADTQQALDYQFLMDNVGCAQCTGGLCPQCQSYKDQTTQWAEPRQRLDGKWAYRECVGQDYTGMTVEPYDENNYA